MRLHRFFFALAAGAILNASITVASAAEYRLVRSIPLQGDGGWDYLTFDNARNRLFITRGTKIQVVDPNDGRPLGEIADTPGVHGVALAQDLGKGYASNGRDASITVFDLETLKSLRRIPTPEGKKPDFITYDASTRRILAFNGASQNVTVVDASTDRVVATIALGGTPESAIVDTEGRVFVALEDRDQLATFSSTGAVPVRTFSLKGCSGPAGLAIDRRKSRLFVACRNRTMLIVDANMGDVLAQVAIGEGVDATTFDDERELAFSSQGDGTLTVVHESATGGYAVVQTVMTAPGARTMALDPDLHQPLSGDGDLRSSRCEC